MYDTNGYLGFTFDGHHSSEYELLVVSDGSRYHQNLSSNFNDTVTSVPGRNGGYYFGTQLGMRDFDINCAFDNMSTHMRDKIQAWLYPNKVGWLIFDEAPYKKYLVKISQVPNFSYLPFSDYKKTKKYSFEYEVLKGEVSFSFFSFYEFGIANENYELPTIYDNDTIVQQAIDSGLIPTNYTTNSLLLPNSKLVTVEPNESINIYNAGNGIASAIFRFYIAKNQLLSSTDDIIDFMNLDDSQDYIIHNFWNDHPLVGNETHYYIEINGQKQEVWAAPILNNKIQENKKINITGYYNQYYPKIYHKKPTEVIVVTQSNDTQGNAEPLFYPLSYMEHDKLPSDSSINTIYSFDEFNSKWSDYLMCSMFRTTEVNDILTPAILFNDLQGFNRNVGVESIIYLIYPNKFRVNKNLTQFTPVYDYTYI